MLLTIAALAGSASPAGAEGVASNGFARDGPDSIGPLDGRPIRAIHLDIRDVFDPVPDGRLRPFYALANQLHVRSRPEALRAQLLFAPGDAWSARHGYEQLRHLRSLDWLQPDLVEARAAGDSVDVAIRTRDAWTTQPEFNLERGGGEVFGTFGLAERNLLGLGKALAIYYHEDPSGVARRLSYEDPALIGSRIRLAWSASDGTAGASDVFLFSQPFWAEEARTSFGVRWSRTGSVARLYETGSEVASFDRDVDEVEAWWGFGRRDADGTVRRLTLWFDGLDRAFGVSQLAASAPPEFDGGEERLKLRRFGAELRVWQPRFVVRRSIDQFERPQDYDLGPSLSLAAGFSPAWLGSTADEGFTRLRFEVGAENALGFGMVRSTLSMRLRRGPLEYIRRADARWIRQSAGGSALVLGGHAVAGSDVPRDFQEVIGGLDGLRAYSVQALAGRRLVRVNAEQRVPLIRDLGGLASVGGAAFWDAGRAWGPGAGGTSWFTDAGFGLRLAPPGVAIGPVFRVDIAWPISPTRDGAREAVITFGSSQAF